MSKSFSRLLRPSTLLRYFESASSKVARGHAMKPSWSIGVIEADSFWELRKSTLNVRPVFEAKQIIDRNVSMVADPFWIQEAGRWYLFFEAYDQVRERGYIALAESADRIHWEYRGAALEEPFHLSYPYVFRHEGGIYMIPESTAAREVRLYRAEPFPRVWKLETTLLRGAYVDSSIFWYQDRWWMFTTKGSYTLELWYCHTLTGSWQPHQANPIYFHRRDRARCAGRVIEYEGSLVRFAQDNRKYYGHQIRAFRIETLTPDEFSEVEVVEEPFLSPNSEGWPMHVLHNVDAQRSADQRWFACIDGG